MKNKNNLYNKCAMRCVGDDMSRCVTLNSFHGLANGKILREISKDKLFLKPRQGLTPGQMLKQVQHDRFSTPINTHSSVIACLTRDLPLWKCVKAQAAFTLAETLIALAVIGIVAALTIPGIVKNYNQKAWGHAQDVFVKKLDVALKEMNTEGTLTGYSTTEDFVNELKKNIKITRICTGNKLTNCFADKVVLSVGDAPIKLDIEDIHYNKALGYDWAETVGVQFSNGVNALIGYNKNCASDPYNNQYSPSASCIGIAYDVSGFKKPNTNGKDIATNGNISLGCAFKFSITVDGKKESVCFTKVLAPGKYNPFPMTINGQTVTCTQALEKGYIESEYTSCTYGQTSSKPDYWAGAQYICGGKKDNMATMEQLGYLATYLYGYDGVIGATQDFSSSEGYKLNTEFLGPFSAYYNGCDTSFRVWSGRETDSWRAYSRSFFCESSAYSSHGGSDRYEAARFAVCVE